MLMNAAAVGKVYGPSSPYEVGREKIREFATAIGDPNPIYLDPEAARKAGYPDVIAPPTFLSIVLLKSAQPLIEDPEVGLQFGSVVHGEQEFEHERPVLPGDLLVASVRISAIFAKGRNEFLTYETTIKKADGERVALARSTMVSLGTATPEGQAA